MKNKEIKNLGEIELKEKIASEVEGLQRLKFGHAISPIENPSKIKVSRKLIARLKTELRSKQILK